MQPQKLLSRAWSGSSMLAGLSVVKRELPDDPSALEHMIQDTCFGILQLVASIESNYNTSYL